MKTINLLLCVFFISFISCKNKTVQNEAAPIPESVYSFVHAYTSGNISRNDAIKIRFAKDAVSLDALNKEPEAKVLSFSPNIKGTAVWDSRNTLVFTPSAPLKAGTMYVATVYLNKIFSDAKNDAAQFEFDFRTKDLGYYLEQDGFHAEDIKNLSKQTYKGRLITSDVIATEKVEKILSAKQDGKALDITWTHGSGETHHFTIEDIKRKEKATAFQIYTNGSVIDLEEKSETKIEIPALNDFSLVSVNTTKGENQKIELNFSDPILKEQNLDGLIRLKNHNDKLRFSVQGNTIIVYIGKQLKGEYEVQLSAGIRNSANKKMQRSCTWNVSFEEQKPQVRIVGKGSIIPNSNGLLLPFEATNLNAVEVEIFKIFNNNVLQFLQDNDIDEFGYRLESVGRVVAQKKIDLKSLSTVPNKNKFVRYALDLSKIMEADPASIYQIRLGFRKSYTDYTCDNNGGKSNLAVAGENFKTEGEFASIWDSYYGLDGYYEDYSYEDFEDPCKGAYYSQENFVRRNLIASDLGIIVKKGTNNKYFATVSDLKNTDPIAGADVEFLDFQKQVIKTVKTDESGMIFTDLERTPSFVIAKVGNQIGYLKTTDGNSLSLSRFDVSGSETQQGLKGFIYGERGVWRPGDSLYLNFILEDKEQTLPKGHPISFTLSDPQGQVREKRNLFENTGGIYALHTTTDANAPTGNWTAKVKVGGATFTKYIKIETVKPNRLKADLNFGKEELTPEDMPTTVQVQSNWLHGAPAKDSDVKIEMQLRAAPMSFPKYSDFNFTDPAREFTSSDREVKMVFEGKTNNQGQASFPLKIYEGENAPSKLIASFKTRVFEKGGDFSTVNSSVYYHPYENYTGVRIPRNKRGSKQINVDKNSSFEFAITDTNGNPIAGKNLNVGIYRANWRWWWERSSDNVTDFSSDNHYNALIKGKVTSDKRGTARYNFKPEKWGRYLVRVCDEQGGHCSGDFVYAGYPWYDEDNGSREEASMLAFNANKEQYNVGETIELNVPSNSVSRVLITLESGSKVIKSFWKDAKKGENIYQIQTTAEMSPTVYAHVALIQPHNRTEKDLPMRMYGVIPINVENPVTKLEPTIAMPDELQPEQKFTVEVSENNDKPMAYTLAVVDEGLLDLTNFSTPSPHNVFYSREALGVQTFDLYDNVLGAYGGDAARILSIGGDIAENAEKKKKQINRFKPVVHHIGPFYLNAGAKTRHEITMPNYVGSVRVMLVAANSDTSYGSTEKTVPVKKPLMVLATLPRVLAPNETLRLPISVFAMDKKVKKANISVQEMSGLVGISDGGQQSISFSQPDEKLIYFDLKVGDNVGAAKFKISGQGNGEQASQEIEIEIRNPNAIATNVVNKTIQAGDSWNATAQPLGVAGTNEGILEISNLPPIDLAKRLKYLIDYPYGCLEQITSQVFPQLYVGNLIELSPQQQGEIPTNIKATIRKLADYHRGDGNFNYWPGSSSYSEWANIYAGHFMMEAEKNGYNVPSNLKSKWIRAAQKAADNYTSSQMANNAYYHDNEFIQTYRLYVLALANKPATGAMNRLRESAKLNNMSRWYLAAAYALSGQKEAAQKLLKYSNTNVSPYREFSNTFGSELRDRAIILEVLSLLGEHERAAEVLKQISTKLSSDRWLSTQEIAYSLSAIGKYVNASDFSSDFNFSYRVGNGAVKEVGSNNPVVNIPIPMESAQSISINNKSKGILFARLITSGQPLMGEETDANSKLKIAVSYTDTKGKSIDPEQITQGTDFIAEVKVFHNNAENNDRYEEIVLSQVFPSGWEILNTRMDDLDENDNTSTFDYQDIRDDAVYTFFDINYGKTRTYKVRLNAAYQGRYYLPATSCSAMYDKDIYARKAGKWVNVVKAESI